MIRYDLYLIFFKKEYDNLLILSLDLIYDDLIYLKNQVKICALQECEFEHVLRSKI